MTNQWIKAQNINILALEQCFAIVHVQYSKGIKGCLSPNNFKKGKFILIDTAFF